MFTPTIPHCSMANIIGLCLRAKLKECLPLHYKVIFAFKKVFSDKDKFSKTTSYICVIASVLFYLCLG